MRNCYVKCGYALQAWRGKVALGVISQIAFVVVIGVLCTSCSREQDEVY